MDGSLREHNSNSLIFVFNRPVTAREQTLIAEGVELVLRQQALLRGERYQQED